MKLWFGPHCFSLFTGWNNEQICSRQAGAPAGVKKTRMRFSVVWHLFFTLNCILAFGGTLSLAGADTIMDVSGVPIPGSGDLSPSIDNMEAGDFERGPSQESYLGADKQPSIQSTNPYGSIYFVSSWGKFGSGQGQFNNPFGVTCDKNDNIYVSDTGNNRIQKFTSTGEFITEWGSSGSIQGKFNNPFGVAVDTNGSVYVVDSDNNRIQKFNSTGGFITAWGSFGSGQGQFKYPEGITLDENDNVYIADTNNHRAQKFNSTGGFITAWGSPGTGEGNFSSPSGITSDKNDGVYITDSDTHRVQKFNNTGGFITAWGSLGPGEGQFNSPYDITTDKNGDVYVADTSNHRIQKFNSTGGFITAWGSLGTGEGQFSAPCSVAVEDHGYVIVADTYNNRIQMFTQDPVIKSVIPDYGQNTDNQQVVITGSSFKTGTNLSLVNGSYQIPGTISHCSNSTIYCSFPLSGAPIQTYALRIKKSDGISFNIPDIFTVTNATTMISTVSPTSGTNAGNQTVTITGTGFRPGLSISLQKGSSSIEGSVVNRTSKRIIGTFPLTDAYPGLYNLNVTNTDGISDIRTNIFTVLQAGPRPDITVFSPASGINTGSVQLTVNGTDFRKGATVTITNGSTNASLSSVKITETRITGTLPLKGLSYGFYTLTVKNSDGSVAIVPDAFTVMNPVPEITSVAPVIGYTNWASTVTISGKNFVSGVQVYLGNGSISIPGVMSGVKATQCTGMFDLAGKTPGLYNVTVINPGRANVSRNGCFTIADPGTGPDITGYSPVSGVNSAPLPFTITGNNFRKGVMIIIVNGTTTKTVSGTVSGTSKIACSLPLKDLPYGLYNLTVRNSDGSNTTRENAFTVMSPNPVLSSVAPSFGYANSSAVVVVSGSKFISGIQAELVNGSTRIQGVVSGLTAAKFTGTFNLSGVSIGAYNLTVTNPGGGSAWKPFSIQSHGTVPVITDYSPVSGANTGTLPFVVNGTNFRKGVTVTITNRSSTKTVTGTVTGSVRITCSLPLNGLPYGQYNLTARNTDGTEVTNADAFSVTSPVPTVKKIAPVSGYNSSPLQVTITGSWFRTGAAIQLTNQSTTVTGTVLSLSETGITGSFPLAGAPAGLYNLTVTNPGGVSGMKSAAFTIISAGTTSAILTINPASGFNTGNLPVTITGTNFRAPSVYLNLGSLYKQVIKTTGKTSTATTLYVTLPLKGVPGGLYNITVRNSDGVNTTAEEIFYVTDQAWYSKVQRTVSRTPVVGIQKLPSVGKTGTPLVVVGPADRQVIRPD